MSRQFIRAALTAFSMIVALEASAGPRQGRARSFVNVKVIVATQGTWSSGVPYPGRPVRWTASGVWFSEDEGHVSEACMLAVYPYGQTYFRNGYVEFPGLLDDTGTLAYRCRGLQEGTCVLLDGQILTAPDSFGQKVRISAVRSCR